MVNYEVGSKVLVPRNGGGESPGEILELYTDRALVKFPIGETYHGKPVSPGFRSEFGYKTLRLERLKPIVCPICRCQLNVTSSAERKDALGREWCQECVNKHDSIDWDEIAENKEAL